MPDNWRPGRHECAGLDALVTNRIWSALGYDPETTLHDIRYGEPYHVNGHEEFVWVFEISGAVPAYAPDATAANLALAAKAAMFREMGLEVSICGTEHGL